MSIQLGGRELPDAIVSAEAPFAISTRVDGELEQWARALLAAPGALSMRYQGRDGVERLIVVDSVSIDDDLPQELAMHGDLVSVEGSRWLTVQFHWQSG